MGHPFHLLLGRTTYDIFARFWPEQTDETGAAINKATKYVVSPRSDGVMQAPGGPEEDPSGGFKFGGWSVPYFDEFVGKLMSEQLGHPFDLLLGRTTYDIFARFWPEQTDETGAAINKATKYFVSH